MGTTSLCGLVWDTETKGVLRVVSRPNDTLIDHRQAYESTQDANRIARSMRDILEQLLDEHPNVEAIGLSGQMHGIVYIDAAGQALTPLYTWQDGRANLPFDGETTYVESLRSITGYPIQAGFGLATHHYHVRVGQIPAGAARICTIADYVAMQLAQTSELVMDPTLAASVGAFDIPRRRFDTDALARAGIDESILPSIAVAGQMVGRYADSIPIYPAIGDNQASFLGAVGSSASTLLVNVGTGAQISLLADDYREVSGWETRPFPGEKYLLVGATMSGGKSYALLEAFFRDVLALAGMEAKQSLYPRMDAALAAASLDTTLCVSPRFYGSRDGSDERGVIANIMASNFTAVDLMIGVLTGVADELKAYYQQLPNSMQGQIDRIVGAGNGIRKNRHLVSLLERTFGQTLSISPYDEDAAVGAALYAAACAEG